MAPKKTKQEKASEAMQNRLEAFCLDSYPEYFDKTKFEEIDLNYVAEISPHEIWRADFNPVGSTDDDEIDSIYLVWNGAEVIGHEDDAESALLDVLTDQKELRARERMRFYASPLIVSGILAVGLFALIAYLSITTTREIPQLWTVFTAVIAFYFGKGGWSAKQKRTNPESL
jgi:hypothetical protein